MIHILRKVKQGQRQLRSTPPEVRNQILHQLAVRLKKNQKEILDENRKDLKGLKKDTPPAFQDRLLLNPDRIQGMIESLKAVAELNDPIGEMVERNSLPNGLQVRKVRAPLGVILMIFESRPNVALEAFSLALKSGNAPILRGGKESRHTVRLFYKIISDTLKQSGFDSLPFLGITNPDRRILKNLLKARNEIDVVVPRGGEGLIQFVIENSLIPIIKNDRGLCHVYLHEDALYNMAQEIIINAKTQRPAVCNSMETLLIHKNLAPTFLPQLYQALSETPDHPPVQWFACPQSKKILDSKPNVYKQKANSWSTEYLDFKMNCKIVQSLEEALTHIDTYGSKHSECIVTQDKNVARIFQDQVDAAVTYWNASTRFTDGFELGLGGELGISTQKLHVRGPVGLKELTCVRWLINGRGQVRK